MVEKKDKIVTFRVRQSTYDKFIKICNNQGETVSTTINQLINNFNTKFKNGKERRSNAG